MKVSVVIPAYNEEATLDKTLESLKYQVEAADEIIVVDNNSTDKTEQIAVSYGARVIKEETQGLIPARNRGFNEGRYEIIARTDADSIVPPTWIADIKKNFENEDVVAVSGPAAFGSSLMIPVIKLMFAANKMIFGHYVLYGPNYAIRKSVWEKIKYEVCPDDDEVHEDVDMGVHARVHGEVAYDPGMKVKTMAWRRKNPLLVVINYGFKWVKMFQVHRNFSSRVKH